LLINQFVRQLLQSVVVVKLSSLFAAITAYIVHTSPAKANASKNRLIRSVLQQFRTLVHIEAVVPVTPDYGLDNIGKCLGPRTYKGPTKDGCKISNILNVRYQISQKLHIN